jgi:hypothetical protein
LSIARIGYLQKEITVGKSNTIELKMEENGSDLKDVVVIGYGKTKRKDVTGAISSISGEELRQTLPSTIDQALEGKVAGVMVQQVSWSAWRRRSCSGSWGVIYHGKQCSIVCNRWCYYSSAK